MSIPRLDGFFSSHSNAAEIVSVKVEPLTVYLEELRGRHQLNFDFILENLTDSDLDIRFIKAAIYDASGDLLTYRYLNRNAVGPSGLDTTGVSRIPAGETVDLYNPFHEFPADLKLASLRYTFTFWNATNKSEYYCGNVAVHPQTYSQKVKLHIPMRGMLTIIDAHDYVSHHRRFAMSLVRQATEGAFAVNFSRFGLDFAMVGEDGNLTRMTPSEHRLNRDFHFDDIRKSYTNGAPVVAPAAGEIIEVVNNLDDMYDEPFDTDLAIRERRIQDIAGNRVTIRHNDREFSHLFHFMKDSIVVAKGDFVDSGQLLGLVGFSGTATVYSHLHYQLMSGKDFLRDEALPVQFEDATLVRGKAKLHLERTSLETGDFIEAPQSP